MLLLLSITLAAGLVVPALFQDGMFADGILYAAVSKNMAEGSGSFWHPHFTTYMHDHFHEQPPLGLFLQSLFFRIFHGIYPERVYDLLLAILDGWLIARIWKTAFRNNEQQQQWVAWPLLLFFLSPVVFWAFTNNVLEITMAAFTLAATNAIFRAMLQEKKMFLLLPAVLWITGASMCKGPQGLFPLALPAILWLVKRREVSLKKAVIVSLVLFAGVAAIYAILLQSPDAQEAYSSWYKNRIQNTFSGNNNTTGTHFSLLFDLMLNMLPLLGVSALIFFLGRKTTDRAAAFSNGHVFFLLALAGSLPLLITREQRPFYLTTAMPYYALAIAAYTVPMLSQWLQRLTNPRGWKITGILVLVLLPCILLVTFLIAGTPKRDADTLADVRLSAAVIGSGNRAACDHDVYQSDATLNYYKRYGNVDISFNVPADFYISSNGQAPEEYEKMDLPLKKLTLFRKKP